MLETFEMLHAVNDPIGGHSRVCARRSPDRLAHAPPSGVVLDEPMVGLIPGLHTC